MTLNYESEGEPLKEKIRRQHWATSPARLNVGLGKTHRLALEEDACPCLGAATKYVNLSDRTVTRRDLVSGGDGNVLLPIEHDWWYCGRCALVSRSIMFYPIDQ
jgi:hypothetical protein